MNELKRRRLYEYLAEAERDGYVSMKRFGERDMLHRELEQSYKTQETEAGGHPRRPSVSVDDEHKLTNLSEEMSELALLEQQVDAKLRTLQEDKGLRAISNTNTDDDDDDDEQYNYYSSMRPRTYSNGRSNGMVRDPIFNSL